jgi:hypothetical protein
MAIFYYKRPESRAKRLAKVIQEAVQKAEKITEGRMTK